MGKSTAVDEARERLGKAERELSFVTAKIEELRPRLEADSVDATAFERIDREMRRVEIRRQVLEREVEAAREAVVQATEAVRQAQVDALRQELAEIRARDQAVLAELRRTVRRLVEEHFGLQEGERRVINRLAADFGHAEGPTIPGDATLAPYPARLWGLPLSLLQERDGVPTAAQVAALVDGLSRDTGPRRIGLAGNPFGGA